MVDARGGLVRPVHDHARQHRRERRAAVDRSAPRTSGSRELEWVVPATRSPSPPSCSPAASSPTSRPPAHLRRRPRRLHASSLACGLAGERELLIGARVVQGVGARDDEPRDALDHHRDLPAAGSAARRSASGPASRRWRSRSARSSAACSPSTSTGAGSSSSTSRSASSASSRRSLSSTSRGTPRASSGSTCPAWSPRRRPLRAHVRADRGEQLRLDVAADPRPLRPRRGRAGRLRRCSSCASGCRCSTCRSSATRRSRAPTRDAARRARDVRRLLLHLALHAEHPRLLAGPRGRQRSCR